MVKRNSLSIAALVLLLSASALAMPKATGDSWRIPYNGYLRVDDGAAQGELAARFTLYDTAGAQLWREEWSDEATRSCSGVDACLIPTVRGRFSLPLGRYVALLPVVRDAEELRLGIALRGVDGAWVELSNRQRIAPSAWALVAETAGDLNARGSVTASGDATIEGQLTAASLTSSATARVGGQLSGARLSSGGAVTIRGAATISGDVTATGALTISGRDLHFGDGSGNGAGGIALSRHSGDVLVFNRGDGFRYTQMGGDLTLNNVSMVNGSLDSTNMGNTWTIPDTGGDFIKTYHINLGQPSTATVCTNCTGNYDLCWVAGYDFDQGDIKEDNSGTIMQVFTYKDGSNWMVYADFRTHNRDEDAMVNVLCARSPLTQVDSTFPAP